MGAIIWGIFFAVVGAALIISLLVTREAKQTDSFMRWMSVGLGAVMLSMGVATFALGFSA